MAYKNYGKGKHMYDVYVRMYARLVEYGRRTIDEVPEIYREDVGEYVKENY